MNIEFPMGLQLPSGYTEIEKGTNKLEQDGFTSNPKVIVKWKSTEAQLKGSFFSTSKRSKSI